jgi:hypothetical protein
MGIPANQVEEIALPGSHAMMAKVKANLGGMHESLSRFKDRSS